MNVSPASCGKSSATDSVNRILKERSQKYTSMTLAGLKRIKTKLEGYDGHIIIDDIAVEKSVWSRTATISVLAHLTYSHYVHKITRDTEIEIMNFYGSAGVNIQPVLMQSIVQDDDWVALVRDKSLRYYHLIRPIKPKTGSPDVEMVWGQSIRTIEMPKYRGILWYQLIAMGLTQWNIGRCNEHIPNLLKACAALDGRERVNVTDYYLLIRLLKPMQLERYVIETYGFETGRTFNNNLYCILVELGSYGNPTMEIICDDYKISPSTAERLIKTQSYWCWIKNNSPRQVLPREPAKKILNTVGVNQRW